MYIHLTKEVLTVKLNAVTENTKEGEKGQGKIELRLTNALPVVMCEPLKTDKRALKQFFRIGKHTSLAVVLKTEFYNTLILSLLFISYLICTSLWIPTISFNQWGSMKEH